MKMILIAILAGLSVALAGVLGWQKLNQPKITPIVVNQSVVKQSVATTSNEIAGWKTYTNQQYGFEFKYPEKLKLAEESNKVILNHSIPYKNYGNCDMSGRGQLSEMLNDFNVSFEIVPQKIILQSIDGKYEVGGLEGDWVYEGAEGCGETAYYFSAGESKTLVIKKAAIQALSGISTTWNRDEVLKISGVITQEESKKIFNQMLSTFKFIK